MGCKEGEDSIAGLRRRWWGSRIGVVLGVTLGQRAGHSALVSLVDIVVVHPTEILGPLAVAKSLALPLAMYATSV